MKRWLKYAGLLALAGATLLAGCAPKTKTGEGGGGTGTPIVTPPAPAPVTMPITKVMVSLTDTGVKVTPPSIPPGPFVVTVTNDSKTDKTFNFVGAAGTPPETRALKVKETTTLNETPAKPMVYTIIVPPAKKGGTALTGKLKEGSTIPPHMPNGMKPPEPGKPHAPGTTTPPPGGTPPPTKP